MISLHKSSFAVTIHPHGLSLTFTLAAKFQASLERMYKIYLRIERDD